MIITPIHESNDCHSPSGPGGGQFCSTDKGTMTGRAEARREAKRRKEASEYSVSATMTPAERAARTKVNSGSAELTDLDQKDVQQFLQNHAASDTWRIAFGLASSGRKAAVIRAVLQARGVSFTEHERELRPPGGRPVSYPQFRIVADGRNILLEPDSKGRYQPFRS